MIRLLLTTAPHDSDVAEQLKTATDAYRARSFRSPKNSPSSARYAPTSTCPPRWFYFGYSSYFTLHDDNHWSYQRAERWLADQACRTLLAAAAKK